MKIKNRKRLNFLIAAFLVVFLTGGTFAFVAAGPLLFQGTANVDAKLELSIMTAEVNRDHNPNHGPNVPDDQFILPLPSEVGPGVHQVSYGVNFNAPGQNAHFKFQIKNTGTMDAEIYDVVFELATIDGIQADQHPNWDVLKEIAGNVGNPSGAGIVVNWMTGGVINPWDSGRVSPMEPNETTYLFTRMWLEPIPEQYNMSKLEHSFEYVVTLTYGLPK
jgi:hypothetical protein